jgi:riboflavin synthase
LIVFTGIIEAVGEVAAVKDLGGGKQLSIRADFAHDLHEDQSVSISGVCQTVIAVKGNQFDVVSVEETLLKTNMGTLQPGSAVNLERSITPATRLDGHLVQGHVDATGLITAVQKQTSSWLFTVSYEERFAPYLIPTGSIAVDGISLTVARLQEGSFTVAIIPYTFDHTIVPQWHEGSVVNLEFDVIGKYVARWLERGDRTSAPDNISMDLLRSTGFAE